MQFLLKFFHHLLVREYSTDHKCSMSIKYMSNGHFFTCNFTENQLLKNHNCKLVYIDLKILYFLKIRITFFIKTFPIKFKTPTLYPPIEVKIPNPLPGGSLDRFNGLNNLFCLLINSYVSF